MAWRYREGFQPEEVEYYTAGNYGPDSNRTFEFSGLVVFSDASIGVLPGYEGKDCIYFCSDQVLKCPYKISIY